MADPLQVRQVLGLGQVEAGQVEAGHDESDLLVS